VAYNKAVSQVVREELLLNIVRRRYAEAPEFLDIASISTSIGLSVEAGASASLDNSATSASSSFGAGINSLGNVSSSKSSVGNGLNFANIGVSGGISSSDSPTVTIVPRTDEEIIKKLTQRIFYDTPQYLANVGYPYDLVFALTVESAGNVHGPQFGCTNDFHPGTREYVELIERLRALIDKNQLLAGTVMLNDPYSDITYPKDSITPEQHMTAVALGTGMGRYRSFDGGKTYYFCDQNYYSFLWIDEDARDSEDGRRVIELLNLNPDPLRRLWKVENAKVPGGGPDYNWQKDDPPRECLNLWPRSFYSVLNFLAFTVEVPDAEITDGRAFSIATYEQAVEDGLAVDLTQYLTVHWSKERPRDAFVAIQHRGKWFYIDDRDWNSKRFFNAVYDLFNIEMSPSAPSGGPVLTLPVS